MLNDEVCNDNLILAKHRYDTFKHWPYGEKSKCSAKNMANAGFIQYDLEAAQCYFCLKVLEGWEENDEPMEERNHKPFCQYFKLKKAEKDMTVGDIINLTEARLKNILILNYEEKIEQMDEEWNKFEKFYKHN